MGLVGKARRKYAEDGVWPMVAWMGSSAVGKVTQLVRHAWYNRQDAYTVTIAGCEATFPSPVADGGAVTRRSLKMEQDLLRTVIESLESDDVFWDVGANVGAYACLAADCVRPENLVAVEPNPRAADQLETNLRLNDAGAAAVLRVALGATTESVSFDIPDQKSFSTRGTVDSNPNEPTQTIEVPQYTLSELLDARAVPAPTVMKLDIEGAEALAVQGFKDGIESCRVLFSEVHTNAAATQSIQTYGMTPQDYIDELAAFGFETEVIADRGTELHLKSVNPNPD